MAKTAPWQKSYHGVTMKADLFIYLHFVWCRLDCIYLFIFYKNSAWSPILMSENAENLVLVRNSLCAMSRTLRIRSGSATTNMEIKKV